MRKGRIKDLKGKKQKYNKESIQKDGAIFEDVEDVAYVRDVGKRY